MESSSGTMGLSEDLKMKKYKVYMSFVNHMIDIFIGYI